jgi:hypothetical protein
LNFVPDTLYLIGVIVYGACTPGTSTLGFSYAATVVSVIVLYIGYFFFLYRKSKEEDPGMDEALPRKILKVFLIIQH